MKEEYKAIQKSKNDIFDELFMLMQTGQITLPKDLSDRIFDTRIQEENLNTNIAEEEAENAFQNSAIIKDYGFPTRSGI